MIKDRVALAKHFNQLGYKLGAEIGTESGSYAATLCKFNPKLKLYCVDMWDLNPSRYVGFRERKYRQAVEVLKSYNCELIKAFSLDAVKQFEDRSLDFVYIDANHSFDSVMRDLLEWGAKVKRGGIIAGDDYNTSSGVQIAVEAYAEAHEYDLNLTTEPDVRGVLSWYFTKGKQS